MHVCNKIYVRLHTLLYQQKNCESKYCVKSDACIVHASRNKDAPRYEIL